MSCDLKIEEIINGRGGSALDRRSFLKCALASGAALGMTSVAEPAAAIPSGAASETEDNARFVVEAKFYQKLQNRKIKCKLRCARKSQRNLLHVGPLAGRRGTR